MSVQLLTVPGLVRSAPYQHVAVGSGARQVHVAGQVSWDADGVPVALGDLTGQVTQALRNTGLALVAAGAGFGDVVRLTFFVTAWTPEQIADLIAGIEAVATELDLPRPLPPMSLIGVQALFEPQYRVEIEAVAVLE